MGSTASQVTRRCAPALAKPLPHGSDPRQVIEDFRRCINMSRSDIEQFLETEESRMAVRQGGDIEHEGRHIGRRVIELMDKIGEQGSNPHAYMMSLLYENDLQTMYQVVEYVRCAREEISKDPNGQVEAMLRWHLMHCGYDPLKNKSTL